MIKQMMLFFRKSDPISVYRASHEPTQAQLEAGNYKKRKIQWNGLTISIETPAGSVRRGVDRDGHTWETRMLYDYGYIRSGQSTGGYKSLAQRCVTDAYILSDGTDTLTAIHRGVDYVPIVGMFVSAVRDLNASLLQRLGDGARRYAELPANGRLADSLAQEFHRLLEVPTNKSLGGIDALILKATHDCCAAYAYLFGDAGNGFSMRSEGFDSLDVEIKSTVQSSMLAAFHDDKIFKAVIKLLPVGVMNVFAKGKFPTNRALDNRTMFLNGLSIPLDDAIWERGAVFIDAVSTCLPIAFASWVAEEIFRSGDVAITTIKRVAAVVALNDRHIISRVKPKTYCSTLGADDEHVDCYFGPYPDAPYVYIVHQRKAGNWKAYDEDKCMIGFVSRDEAITAFLKHYSDPRFLGPVTEMPVVEFKKKVLGANGMMAKASPILLFMARKPSR